VFFFIGNSFINFITAYRAKLMSFTQPGFTLGARKPDPLL